MAKKYVYIDGVRYEVVNNYILGLDVYSDDSIPTPVVADSGKVLGVDEEGKYALTEAGGGGGIFMVEFGGESTDKTPSQLFQALSNGLIVMVHSLASESYNRWEMALSIVKDDESIGSSDYTTLRTSSWTFTSSADDELLTLSE